MPTEVIMPKVDMDMTSGKIAAWHASAGEKVEKGAPLFDIETDKAAMEVEAPASGYLHHVAPEGADIPIGAPVGWIYGEGEDVGEAPAAAGQVTEKASVASKPGAPPATPADGPSAPATGPEPQGAQAAGGPANRKLRATPLARSLAADSGIDLFTVPASGPNGRVQADDVRAVLERPAAAAPSMPAPFADEPGPLSVTRSGSGPETPVVFVHGFANDAAGWAPLERHLRDRTVIRIDLPCHGKSPRRRYRDFADIVSDIRRAIDDLPEETLHLVAHSLGGALAIALADTRPRKVESLTLIAPAGLGPDINGDALHGILRATRPESLAPWLKLLVADEKLITDGYARAAMAARSDATLRAAQTALAETVFPDGVQAHSLKPALDRLDMPVRIVWGKRDAIIPWRHALAAPGNVALHLFDDLGHMPHVEAPDEMGLLLRRYL